MNTDRNMKLLLMKLGRKGHDVTLTREQRYSQQYDSVYTRFKLTFWIKMAKQNKRTGESKECKVPITHEFGNAIELLQYMVVRANE